MDRSESRRIESEARRAAGDSRPSERAAAAWAGVKRYIATEALREHRIARHEKSADRDQSD